MDRTLHVVGKNSSEIFLLRYPRSLLIFCEYDFAYFAESAIAVCDEALKTGELDYDRVTDLRNSLKSAHVCIENNIRTVYDKIVLDCWIDYVCRRDNVGTGTLWNRFMSCNTSFEKVVFMRLCEYRYNRAINEWLNLIRVQDYAKNKISFIFADDIKNAAQAASRRNYFDLMFSVTARELGCNIEELGVTKVFSVGRVPTAPFMFSNISKEVVKSLLSDFDYSEDYSDSEYSGTLADQIAMDAFSYMKGGLSAEYNSYNISRYEMENAPTKLYMPCGMKAVVDLEIDALIESGGWLARCRRCGRYYVRDEEYPHEYCSLFNPGGKTCLEIYELEHPKKNITPELEKSFREITDEMYSRVGSTMSLEEYESWKVYLDSLYDQVDKGTLPVEELSSFIAYSRSLDISRSNPVTEVVRKEAEPVRERERVVKPFIPQRIDRSELEAQQPKMPVEREIPEEPSQPRGRSFFTSPSVQRQKQENAPISHIIRAEQSADLFSRKPQGFTPFGSDEPMTNPRPAPRNEERPVFTDFGAPARERTVVEKGGREVYRAGGIGDTAVLSAAEKPFAAPVFDNAPKQEVPSEEDIERVSAKLRELLELKQAQEAAAKVQEAAARVQDNASFEVLGGINYDSGDNLESFGNMFDLERDSADMVQPMPEQTPRQEQVSVMQEQEAPRPKVIRKNAAAISAYGKISGAPVISEQQARAEQRMSPVKQVEDNPFENVGAIFDDIEQSELPTSSDKGPAPAEENYFAFDRASEQQNAVPSRTPAGQGRPAPAEDYFAFDRENEQQNAASSRTPAGQGRPAPAEENYFPFDRASEQQNAVSSRAPAGQGRTAPAEEDYFTFDRASEQQNAASSRIPVGQGRTAPAEENYFAFDRASEQQNAVSSRTPAGQGRTAPAEENYFAFDRASEQQNAVSSRTPAGQGRTVPAEENYFAFDRESEQQSAVPTRTPAGQGRPAPVEKIPEKVTADNAPSGIWTEERGLFSDAETDEELSMLKDKKRSRSNKTQRLFDAIMREPEDNPNMRRKK